MSVSGKIARAKRWVRTPPSRYFLVIALLLVGGALLIVFGPAGDSDVAVLLRGVAEAALIAGLLAFTVDPYLKTRLRRDAIVDGLLAMMGSPRAPSGLRRAIEELAECRQFLNKNVWTVDFSWEVDHQVLAVTTTAENWGLNIDSDVYKPKGKLWVLGSTERDGRRYVSRYVKYELECSPAKVSVHRDEAQLAALTKVEADGTIVLKEGKILGSGPEAVAIPPGAQYRRVQAAVMYRDAVGYLPLMHSKFAEELVVKLTGSALAQLDVRITHPQSEGRDVPKQVKSDETLKPPPSTFENVTPGQVTLITWALDHRRQAAPTFP